jgi:hypothetical protein
MFDIALFSSENFRNYFITCDVRYLPVGTHGALLIQPPCMAELFSPPFVINLIVAISLVAGGFASIMIGFRVKNQFASATLHK